MEDKLFNRLIESMRQMNEIDAGERAPSREFIVNPLNIKDIRRKTELSQTKFSELIDVNLATLRNWE